MYETFYGLTLKPFTLVPNPDFLYRAETHRLAMATLEYGILNQAGFVVLTGQPGMGKTTLIQQILADHRNHFTIGLITNTSPGMDTLLPWILLAFGQNDKSLDKVEGFHALQKFLHQEATAHRRVMLIIDEAQNLGVRLLEELRLLSNLNKDKAPVLQIVLSGQPDLRQTLQRKDLTQFAQRVMVDYDLAPFNQDDSIRYIAHRLRIAGRVDPIFTSQASQLIHQLSAGIPRLINQLCDTALTYGFAEQTSFVSTKTVTQAAKDRGKGGILPLTGVDRFMALTPEQEEAERAELAAFGSRTSSSAAPTTVHANGTSVTSPPEPVGQDASECYERGLALKKVGRHKEALQQFAMAAEHTAFMFKATAQVGICLKSTDQPEEAVTAFRKALQAQRTASADAIQVRYLLARTLESLGHTDETLEQYRLIRRESPGFKDVAERLERMSSRRAVPPRANEPTRESGSWMAQLQRILGASK